MAASEPFHRMSLRTFQRFGAVATVSPNILAAAADNNTVSASTFKVILDEDVGQFADSGVSLSDKDVVLSVLASDFAQTVMSDHAIIVSGALYELRRRVFDDGTEIKFIAREVV